MTDALDKEGLVKATKAANMRFRSYFPGSRMDLATAQEVTEAAITAYLSHAPRPDMERELAEARAVSDEHRDMRMKLFIEAAHLKAKHDALAADKARLVDTTTEAREVVSAIAGENQPAREWAMRVRDKIDAALSGASIPAPADKAEARREALEEAARIADGEQQSKREEASSAKNPTLQQASSAQAFTAGRIATAIRALTAAGHRIVGPADMEKAVERLKDAVEGECDGLAIDDAQANAILEYVLTGEPPI